MRRTILLALSLLFSLTSVFAGDYSKYYQNLPKAMPEVTVPTIPANTVSILDCGGKGDGITSNTEAFRKAISKLSKLGGGHLNVPAGIYLTGLISFKDNIDRKEKQAALMVAEMVQHTKEILEEEIRGTVRISIPYNPQIEMTIPDWLVSA